MAKTLDSKEKVAILLLALGEDIAADIFKNLSEQDIKKIAPRLSQLKQVDQKTIDLVFSEFYQLLSDPTRAYQSGANYAKTLLEKAFPGEQGDSIRELISAPPELTALLDLDAPRLANLMASEHPQTIALILAFCPPKLAADTLSRLPEALQPSLMIRLAHLGPVDPQVIEDIDQHLKEEVAKMGGLRSMKLGGSDKVAKILAAMGKASSEKILDDLADQNQAIAEEVRGLMFTFQDLVKVSDKGIQLILQKVDQKLLMVAMKTAPDAVREHFLGQMSERARKRFEEDCESLGKLKLSEVEAAQAEITSVAQALEQSGDLTITSEDEVYV